MGAVVYDIEADQGGLVQVPFAVTESDGSAADLTGYTGEFEVWTSHRDDATRLVIGSVSINAGTGIVTCTISGDDTVDATWRSGVYDVKIDNNGAGGPEYVARGAFRLRPTVTR